MHKLREAFLRHKTEQGFLLGCKLSSGLEVVDVCSPLPALQAGRCFYMPDPQAAEAVIRTWTEQGICFHGMVHSHIVPKRELSEDDVSYAMALAEAYQLPIFWFGIGIVMPDGVEFAFYRVSYMPGGKTEIQKEEI